MLDAVPSTGVQGCIGSLGNISSVAIVGSIFLFALEIDSWGQVMYRGQEYGAVPGMSGGPRRVRVYGTTSLS